MKTNQDVFNLPVRPPYRWNELVAFLGARATPGVEAVEAGVYRRSISRNGSDGWIEVSHDRANHSLVARVQFPDAQSLSFIRDRIRAMFDLDANWRAIARVLRGDRLLAKRVDAVPGLRVPGCWDGFEMAVRAIIGQQISVKAATTVAGRIAREFGRPSQTPIGLTHVFPSAEVLSEAPLTRVGLTTARAATIRSLARAVRDGEIRFDGVADVEEFRARMCEIPGIGNWTAQYVAMRALGEPDAFPSGDLGLLHALGVRSSRELERRAEAWRPWRSYATMYLWNVPGA